VFPLPVPGEIVYCRFPEAVGAPGPKPRPCLVIAIIQFGDGTPGVRVVYGTSQKTNEIHAGEFVISRNDGEAYESAGLSYTTKFNFRRSADLPYSDEWFRVPPMPFFGQTPKLGILHPTLVRRAEAAFRATSLPAPKRS
jgi:hypothetical protein